MKHILYILVLLIIATGCNNNTYSKELKQEQKLIDNYIRRNNIHPLKAQPYREQQQG